MATGWSPNTQATSVLSGAAARAAATAADQVGGRLARRRARTPPARCRPRRRPAAPPAPAPGRRRPASNPRSTVLARSRRRPHCRRRRHRGADALAELGQRQPGVDAGVGGQGQRAAAVADQRHPVARRAAAGRPAPGRRRAAGPACRPGSRRSGRAARRSVPGGSVARRSGRPGPRRRSARRRWAWSATRSRAMRLNLRALPNDSRYSSTSSVRSSSAQYCSRSLADTSARLPMAANDDAPRPAVADAVEQRAADRPRLGQQRRPARAGGSGWRTWRAGAPRGRC